MNKCSQIKIFSLLENNKYAKLKVNEDVYKDLISISILLIGSYNITHTHEQILRKIKSIIDINNDLNSYHNVVIDNIERLNESINTNKSKQIESEDKVDKVRKYKDILIEKSNIYLKEYKEIKKRINIESNNAFIKNNKIAELRISLNKTNIFYKIFKFIKYKKLKLELKELLQSYKNILETINRLNIDKDNYKLKLDDIDNIIKIEMKKEEEIYTYINKYHNLNDEACTMIKEAELQKAKSLSNINNFKKQYPNLEEANILLIYVYTRIEQISKLENEQCGLSDKHNNRLEEQDIIKLQLVERKAEIKRYIKEYRKLNSYNLPENSFFNKQSKDIETTQLFNLSEFNKKQAELFYWSLRVLEIALIENLFSLYDIIIINNNKLDLKNPSYLSALSFFFPVMSTTLASSPKMLKYINKVGSIICDESGQATVQSGFGIMNKTLNSLIVGDPLQIEPVVTILDNINDILVKEFSVTNDIFNVKCSSIQAISDNSTSIGAYYGKIRVGMPLMIHNRCEAPIFDISNDISYGNKIINSTKSTVCLDGKGKELPKSVWYHIETEKTLFDGNISRTEKLLVDNFINQYKLFSTELSIFTISPFKDNGDIYGNSAFDFGTLHSFQGREADIVFLVLGGKSKGAKQWASAKANLLNVAATRAKKRLYIVGNYDEWGSLSFFKRVNNHLGKCKIIKKQQLNL